MTIGRRRRSRHATLPRRHARTATRAPRRLTVLAAAVPIGLVASVTLVWSSSYAAFVDTTTSPENTWGTGVVELGTDRGATALFSTASEGLLVPGSSGHKCITVTYSGNVDTAAPECGCTGRRRQAVQSSPLRSRSRWRCPRRP